MPSAPRLTLRVTGSTDGVRLAVDAFAAFLAEHRVAADAAWNAQVALDEALSNIVMHAYRGTTGEMIDIICAISGQELQVTIADDGAPYDPSSAPAADTSSPLEMRRPGGLGVRLMTELMDVVDYSRREDRNTLTMRRRVARGHDAG